VPAPLRSIANRSRRGRRRGRRNPSFGVNAFLRLLGPGALGAVTALAGWVAAKTLLKEKDSGIMGVAANAAGSLAAALVLTSTVAKRNPTMRAGIMMGAVIGPTLRFAVDSVRGRTLPLGLRTGFEDYSPMTLGDFFTTRPMVSSAPDFRDFLAQRRRPAIGGEASLGYGEGGSSWAGSMR
jgi:uncharacterized membrane protein YeaQ/YmgE (transglycosylase-associated protein family)